MADRLIGCGRREVVILHAMASSCGGRLQFWEFSFRFFCTRRDFSTCNYENNFQTILSENIKLKSMCATEKLNHLELRTYSRPFWSCSTQAGFGSSSAGGRARGARGSPAFTHLIISARQIPHIGNLIFLSDWKVSINFLSATLGRHQSKVIKIVNETEKSGRTDRSLVEECELR